MQYISNSASLIFGILPRWTDLSIIFSTLFFLNTWFFSISSTRFISFHVTKVWQVKQLLSVTRRVPTSYCIFTLFLHSFSLLEPLTSYLGRYIKKKNSPVFPLYVSSHIPFNFYVAPFREIFTILRGQRVVMKRKAS